MSRPTSPVMTRAPWPQLGIGSALGLGCLDSLFAYQRCGQERPVSWPLSCKNFHASADKSCCGEYTPQRLEMEISVSFWSEGCTVDLLKAGPRSFRLATGILLLET